MNNKIDLSKIKLAIFDFDDTLEFHIDRKYEKFRNMCSSNLMRLTRLSFVKENKNTN